MASKLFSYRRHVGVAGSRTVRRRHI
jgi:hypothetical protein